MFTSYDTIFKGILLTLLWSKQVDVNLVSTTDGRKSYLIGSSIGGLLLIYFMRPETLGIVHKSMQKYIICIR